MRSEELSDELKGLILEEEQATANNERATNISGTTSARPRQSSRARSVNLRFQVGDRIVITNNYRGHFGRTGTVTRVDEDNDWVYFHQDTPLTENKAEIIQYPSLRLKWQIKGTGQLASPLIVKRNSPRRIRLERATNGKRKPHRQARRTRNRNSRVP